MTVWPAARAAAAMARPKPELAPVMKNILFVMGCVLDCSWTWQIIGWADIFDGDFSEKIVNSYE
ncbi:hypothetical protein D3C71_1824120 [compost metagenome]